MAGDDRVIEGRQAVAAVREQESAVQARSAPLQRLGQLLLLAVLLYLFLLSIEMLGGSFKLFGKGFAETLIATTSNPFVGLFIGVLATSLVQSSSTVTSLTVSLVAVGGLTIEGAVPIVMGANIGTSVTNTIVSMGHITRSREFQRAFEAATVHDNFNLLAVGLLFPLQLATGFLSKTATLLAGFFLGQGGATFKSPLKLIVKPAAEVVRETLQFVFSSNGVVAVVMALLALAVLFVSLQRLVVLLKRLMLGRVELVMQRYVFESALRAMILGCIVTILVQSSSVTTSVIVPLVAAGILTLERVFPFVLGANVGTTATALLASLVTGSSAAVTVALCHLLFNASGLLVFYPLRRIPIGLSRWLGRLTLRSRLYALAYILLVFFAVPITLILIFR